MPLTAATLHAMLPRVPDHVTRQPLWQTGDPANPQAGDLWVLGAALDGQHIDLTLALIARNVPEGGYCLCFPVTFDPEPTGADTLLLDSNPLGVPLYLWPAYETGVDHRTLHRRIGHALDATTLRQARRYAFRQAPAPLPAMDEPVYGTAADTNLNNTVADLCRTMQIACYAHSSPHDEG